MDPPVEGSSCHIHRLIYNEHGVIALVCMTMTSGPPATVTAAVFIRLLPSDFSLNWTRPRPATNSTGATVDAIGAHLVLGPCDASWRFQNRAFCTHSPSLRPEHGV